LGFPKKNGDRQDEGAPIAFAALSAAALAGYVASLNALNGLAEAKKELLIETLTR